MAKKQKAAVLEATPVDAHAVEFDQMPESYKQKTEENWKARIGKIQEVAKRAANYGLQYRYDIGTFVLELLAEKGKSLKDRKYGKYTTADLAAQLNCSPSSISSYQRFASRATPEQLKRFQENGWPWRNVDALMSVNGEQRQLELQKQFESGAIAKTSEFVAAAAEANATAIESGEKVEKRGSRQAKTKSAEGGAEIVATVKAFNAVCGTIESRFAHEMLAALKMYKQTRDIMSDRSLDSTVKGLTEMKKRTKGIRVFFEKLEKELGDTPL